MLASFDTVAMRLVCETCPAQLIGPFSFSSPDILCSVRLLRPTLGASFSSRLRLLLSPAKRTATPSVFVWLVAGAGLF
jgi:hypothetical protein